MSLFEKALTVKKNELKKRGRYFKVFKKLIEEQIANNKQEISSLEKELEETMPATLKGEIYCKECGVKSIKYIGWDEKEKHGVYKCEICDEKLFDELSRYT